MNVPKLRFKEFNDEWSVIKLKDILCEKKEKTGDIQSFPLWSLTIENGVTPKTDRYERGFLVKKEDNYKIVSPNDFVYNPMNAHLGAIARHKGNSNISVSGYYDVFSMNDNNYSFYENYFVSPLMFKKYKLISTGSLIEKQRVHFSQFKELDIHVPSNLEKAKISKMLQLLDKKIELQNKKIEDLKLFKKGLNKNIFSNFNAKYKVDELIKEYNKKTSENNQFEVLSSTANGIILQTEYFNKQAASPDNTGYKIVPFGFITYRSMSDTGEFHFNIQNIIENGIVSPAYPVFEINEDIVDKTYFVYYINENKSFKNKILSSKEGGTRYALSISKFKEINLDLPTLEYQKKCSKLLNTYNKKIKNEENKLDKLQGLKKGLMQNMFV